MLEYIQKVVTIKLYARAEDARISDASTTIAITRSHRKSLLSRRSRRMSSANSVATSGSQSCTDRYFGASLEAMVSRSRPPGGSEKRTMMMRVIPRDECFQRILLNLSLDTTHTTILHKVLSGWRCLHIVESISVVAIHLPLRPHRK